MHILADPATAGLHFLSGTPGSGETFTTKYLCHTYVASQKKVLLTGTTDAAATRLDTSANTVHSAFRIPNTGAYTFPLQVLQTCNTNPCSLQTLSS